MCAAEGEIVPSMSQEILYDHFHWLNTMPGKRKKTNIKWIFANITKCDGLAFSSFTFAKDLVNEK